MKVFAWPANEGTGTSYKSREGFTLDAAAKWETVPVAEVASATDLKQALSIHQQGQTDYLTFCRQAAGSGVDRWVVDMQQMCCTYHDKAGNALLEEAIPSL